MWSGTVHSPCQCLSSSGDVLRAGDDQSKTDVISVTTERKLCSGGQTRQGSLLSILQEK